MNTKKEIKNIGEKLILLLSKKNDDYGDSATQGDAIFATKQNMKRMSPKQFGLCCRLDDKIYRIRNSGISYKTVDPELTKKVVTNPILILMDVCNL